MGYGDVAIEVYECVGIGGECYICFEMIVAYQSDDCKTALRKDSAYIGATICLKEIFGGRHGHHHWC